MGYREYARHRGCALSAVQKAIKTGRIQAVDGKIDSEAADRAWAASTDPAKQRKEPLAPPPAVPLLDGEPIAAPASLSRRVDWPEVGPWPPPVVRQPEPPQQQQPENVVGMDTFLSAKTERERAEAELAKIALMEKRGSLISAEKARQTWQTIGKMYAQARENLPTELATKLVGKTDPHDIELVIRAMLREADQRLADDIQARFASVVDDVRYGSIAG